MRHNSKKQKRIITLIGIFFILILSVLAVFSISRSPINQARKQTIAVAQKRVGLNNPGEFYLFDYDKTYYTISGDNKYGKPIYVIVYPKTGSITVLNHTSGFNHKEILNLVKNNYSPYKILNGNLGLYKNQPVWDVSFLNKKGQLNFLILSFKNGSNIKYIKNV